MVQNRPQHFKPPNVPIDTKLYFLHSKTSKEALRWWDKYCDSTFTLACIGSRLCPFNAPLALPKSFRIEPFWGDKFTDFKGKDPILSQSFGILGHGLLEYSPLLYQNGFDMLK